MLLVQFVCKFVAEGYATGCNEHLAFLSLGVRRYLSRDKIQNAERSCFDSGEEWQ